MVYDLVINQVGLYFKVIVNLVSHWTILKAVQGVSHNFSEMLRFVNPKRLQGDKNCDLIVQMFLIEIQGVSDDFLNSNCLKLKF